MSTPLVKRLLEAAPNLLNKTHRLSCKPFDPNTPIPPPSGRRRSWVHYGVMIPDLPAPHRMFNLLSIVGTPGATVFDNDYAVTTTPQDTAYLLSTTASMASGSFRAYSIAEECDFATDGSRLRFGEELLIEGQYPNWSLQRHSDELRVELSIVATRCVSHFAKVLGLYTHWSLLSRYAGVIEQAGESQSVSGLCTFEYAAGVGRYSVPGASFPAKAKIPINYFTYQVINLDARTQLLLVCVLGPSDVPIQRAAYLRSLDDDGAVYTRNVRFTVDAFLPEAAETPDGHRMRLPHRFRWYGETDSGEPLLSLECTVQGDFHYGLGAGYASWFLFDGRCQGRAVSGQGYLEFIDRR
ncbi:DUF6670 family protein [Algiphilus sp.]|uniref:DUF6670 family protein n=1 Tax=Algiphilus sp. TaxID=1872431 RepID=UPI0032EB963E